MTKKQTTKNDRETEENEVSKKHIEAEESEVTACLKKLADCAVAHDAADPEVDSHRCQSFRTSVVAALMHSFQMELRDIGFIAEDWEGQFRYHGEPSPSVHWCALCDQRHYE